MENLGEATNVLQEEVRQDPSKGAEETEADTKDEHSKEGNMQNFLQTCGINIRKPEKKHGKTKDEKDKCASRELRKLQSNVTTTRCMTSGV